MTDSLTAEQIASMANAVRDSLLQQIDSHISTAIQALGINPGDISDEQFNEIVDEVFG